MVSATQKVVRVGQFEQYRITNGWFGAPIAVRALVRKTRLGRIKALREVRRVLILWPKKDRPKSTRPRRAKDFYWALISVEQTTAGVARKKYFYFSIAVETTNGRHAVAAARKIAKDCNAVSVDHHFRKVVSRAKVLLVEWCETQLGDKKPDHLVMMRTMQKSGKHLSLKALIDQLVPLD